MAESPLVYIFHGEDEGAQRQALAALQEKLGDPTTVAMNTTLLEGPALSLDSLRSAALATPFLSQRRLVAANGAAKAFSNNEPRAAFLQLLDELPTSTAMVLLENSALKDHWLLKWARVAGTRAFVKQFDLPKGPEMAAWLQEHARQLGGELQPQAAVALAQLAGSNKSAAGHELEKLLAFVAYSRPIEAADVASISLPIGEQGDFFGLLDSLADRNGARAMQTLETLLLERDHVMLFFSLVGHFRLLLQTRDLVDQGQGEEQIAKQLSIHPYRAKKLAAQARRFSPQVLQAIYERLQDLDAMIKTGKIEIGLAMENFVAGLSVSAA